jgi:hypothetical protein
MQQPLLSQFIYPGNDIDKAEAYARAVHLILLMAPLN